MGVVTVEVVVLDPAPALRRLVEGRVRVDVTGRGRLVVGRVRVDVVGRVWVAVVVMGAVVVMVGGGGAVVAGALPVPATGGSVNAFKASSTLTG